MKQAIKKNKAIGLLLTLMVCSTSLHAATPGVTPGEFRVDASGSANYQVPIAVPPGTAGMQPALMLSYNHRSGNGLIGVGWTLGGLSVITRCPATTVVDGEIDGIDFDAKDRYCIDGQRLIQVTGSAGDYGKHDIEYRTEVDGFTKVVSKDTITTNNGPESFIAYTKSGQILEYGNTSDSRIEAVDATTGTITADDNIRLWAVNKIEDTVGNYLTVTYTEDSSNGEYRPIEIDYTGNANATPVLTPNTSVEFEYATRTDDAALYFAGSKVQNTQRLTNIKTYTGTTLVRDYQLTYDNNGAAGRSRLTQLQECDGQSTQDCFKPIVLGWLTYVDNAYKYGTDNTIQTTGYGNGWNIIPGDINGDGITDLIGTHIGVNDGIHTLSMLADGNGGYSYSTSNTIQSGSGYGNGWKITTGDIDGDGLTDLIAHYIGVSDGVHTLTIPNNGNGGFSYGTYKKIASAGYGNGWKISASDIDGDGLTDLIAHHIGVNDGIHTLTIPNDGNGSFSIGTSNTIQSGSGYGNGWRITLGEINGDGLTDLIAHHIGVSDGVHTLTIPNNGSGGFSYGTYNSIESSGYGNGWRIIPGDVNGDGLTDLIANLIGVSDGIHTLTIMARGDGSYVKDTYNTIDSPGYGNGWTMAAGDINGDGLTDLVANLIGVGDGVHALSIPNQGDNSFVYGTYKNISSPGYSSGWSMSSGDTDGDGLMDLIATHIGVSDGVHTLTVPEKETFPDILTSVTDSLGSVSNITYKPLTDSTVYTKGSGAMYPEVDIQSPVYVVSKVTVDDGIGGTRDTDYSYSEAKSSLDGRGFLGFNTMTAVDSATGIKTTTTYKQTHPYIGLVERTEQRLSNDDLIGEVDTTFGQTQTHTGVEVDASHPGVLFPYAATVTKQDYEIGGTP